MNDLVFSSLQAQIAALQHKQISSVELVQEHLKQIQAINPEINALVQVAAERARKEARIADEERAHGTSRGILHGLPFTVKDSLETEGIITTAGTLGFKDVIPHQDATIVRRLRAIGAIVLGKTNCSEMVMPFETDNLVYGRTHNPWNLGHSPGGSSGGEAAAIACGCSPLGVAGDAGASIRKPAHFCGITGIKATTGRIPRTGHIPVMGGATGAASGMGPMARTVGDLELVLPFLCGGDGIDAACMPVPYYDPADVEIQALKIAFYVDNGIMAADPESAEAVYRSARILEKAGATIAEAIPPGMTTHLDVFNSLFNADGGERIRLYLQRIGSDPISPALQRIIDHQPDSAISTAQFMTLLGRYDKIRSQMLGFMQQYDVIICPVTAFPAPPHNTLTGEDNMRPVSYTMTYNLVGYPSASVPVTRSSSDLPIGVQVVAGAWREDRVLAVAKIIEAATGGYQRPPLVQR